MPCSRVGRYQVHRYVGKPFRLRQGIGINNFFKQKRDKIEKENITLRGELNP
jgi:hypothetical protein